MNRSDLYEHKNIKNNNSRYRILEARIDRRDLDWTIFLGVFLILRSIGTIRARKKKIRNDLYILDQNQRSCSSRENPLTHAFRMFGREEYTFPHLVTSLSVCLCGLRVN